MSSPWAARRPLSCRAATIFKAFGPEADFGGSDWQPMIDGLWKKTFGDAERSDPETVEAAYRRYLDRVRETIPASRLVEFETGAG